MPQFTEHPTESPTDEALHGTLSERLICWSKPLVPFYWWLSKRLIRAIYRPTLIGFEQIPKTGPAVLIANHVSYLDGLMINAACDRPVRFVIDKIIYRKPGIHYFMKLAGAVPIFPKREDVEKALDIISEGLQAGELICIFPEGRLTYTGNLGRFRPGVEYILERDPVPVYPIAIDGLWGSIFSRKYLRAKWRWWPRNRKANIRLTCGAPLPPEAANINRLQKEVMGLLSRR